MGDGGTQLMCLIIAVVFMALAINAYMHQDTTAALLYTAISLLFIVLMGLNIKRVWKKRHEEASR